MAEILLRSSNGKWFRIFMYVDSGADITLIPRQLGEALGLKIDAEKIEEIKGIGEKTVPVQIERVRLKIGEKELNPRIAWSLIEEIPLILGRVDVFEKFKITFDERKCKVIFEG